MEYQDEKNWKNYPEQLQKYLNEIKSFKYQDEEEWIDVLDYEGLYKISSHGRLRSFHANRTNDGWICPATNKKGYYQIMLRDNGRDMSHRNHIMVAEAFFGHKRCGMDLIVHHKNHNKKMNHKNNLETATNRENSSQRAPEFKGSSKYTGVSRYTKGDKVKPKYSKEGILIPNADRWIAFIRVPTEVDGVIKSKSVNLGIHPTELLAGQAYQNKLAEITGKPIVILQ